MEFSRQGYWSGLPFPSPGDLPYLGIEPGSPQADSLLSEPPGKPRRAYKKVTFKINLTKVHLVKVMVFPVVIYGCESWTIKKSESEVAQSCPTLCDPMDCSLSGSTGDFPGKSSGVDWHFLLQGIFPTQESNPGLPHCRQTLYRLSYQGSPL